MGFKPAGSVVDHRLLRLGGDEIRVHLDILVADKHHDIRNAAIGTTSRVEEMQRFVEGVGEGHSAGVWEDVPKDRPEFKAKRRKAAAVKPVEEMGSC